jgi:hypothetical protein
MNMPRWLHYTLLIGFSLWMAQSLVASWGQFSFGTVLCLLFLGWNLFVLYKDLRPRFDRWRTKRRTAAILDNFKRRNPDFKPSKPS